MKKSPARPPENAFLLTPFFLDTYQPKLETLWTPGWALHKPSLPEGDQQTRLSVVHLSLAGLVSNAIAKGLRPISIAGDCCAAIGVLAGLRQAQIDPTLIWLDAHGDFNHWESTPSGFLGGMPLAMLVGIGEQTMIRAVGLKNIAEEKVILSDARDLDPGEEALLMRSNLRHVKQMENMMDIVLPSGPLWVHLDLDVIDPGDAPAMGYPAAGGPSLAVVREVLLHLARTGRVQAVSVSTWNPELDLNDKTQKVCMPLIQTFIAAC